VRNDAIKAAQAEPFARQIARQIGGCVQILPRVWVENMFWRSTLCHVCLCWSLQVTKVTIPSTIFSLKEEQDHEGEKKKLPRASLSSLFLF
jgi:hypothetical protein